MWEKIDDETQRMEVPHGWIVKSTYYMGNSVGQGVGASVALIFIEDKTKSWKL